MGTQRNIWKGLFLGWFVGLSMPVQETFILPWLLWSAQYKIFFPTIHYFNLYVPVAQQPRQGSRAGPPYLHLCPYIYSLSSSNVYQLITLSPILRRNSWKAFLVGVSGRKLELLTRVLFLVFTLTFPYYKMLFMNRLKFSCFADFFVCKFKTRVEYGFFKNPPVEGTVNSIEQKTRVFFSNWCSRVPSLIILVTTWNE